MANMNDTIERGTRSSTIHLISVGFYADFESFICALGYDGCGSEVECSERIVR
jgi:hypothetical protein